MRGLTLSQQSEYRYVRAIDKELRQYDLRDHVLVLQRQHHLSAHECIQSQEELNQYLVGSLREIEHRNQLLTTFLHIRTR